MAREIEIKVRLQDKSATLAALAGLGVDLSEPKKQHDVVYAWPGVKDNAPGSVWLRIRTENDKIHTFTLKKQHIGSLDSIEHETNVEDPKELGSIITEMGYELYSDLTKIRQKGKHGDIEVCVDEVPGLGSFIEAELIMEHDSDHDEVVKQLWDFMEELGLDKKDEEHKGYDEMERAQRGL